MVGDELELLLLLPYEDEVRLTECSHISTDSACPGERYNTSLHPLPEASSSDEQFNEEIESSPDFHIHTFFLPSSVTKNAFLPPRTHRRHCRKHRQRHVPPTRRAPVCSKSARTPARKIYTTCSSDGTSVIRCRRVSASSMTTCHLRHLATQPRLK